MVYVPVGNAGRKLEILLPATGRWTAQRINPRNGAVEPLPATEEEIRAVHTPKHVAEVRREGVYDIAALAAGGAIRAAEIGRSEPCFAVIRPPGHHASADSAWGFCSFNNMAIALTALKRKNKIHNAFILDFDMHLSLIPI